MKSSYKLKRKQQIIQFSKTDFEKTWSDTLQKEKNRKWSISIKKDTQLISNQGSTRYKHKHKHKHNQNEIQRYIHHLANTKKPYNTGWIKTFIITW